MTVADPELSPSQILHNAMEAARTRYPDLGLSFGYIGNLERWGDDRSWRIFTKLSDRHTNCCNVSWGGVGTANLATLATPEALARLNTWLQKQAALLGEGMLFQINRDAWLAAEIAHAAKANSDDTP
jgi:hypothetical protein